MTIKAYLYAVGFQHIDFRLSVGLLGGQLGGNSSEARSITAAGVYP
ncbi:hypothetical protein [Treponema endosymbiont of Eucomonympha sp.]|nr:hypothetical protein [Treponema endosymbiont of Eucomonympha sp.]